MTPSVHCPSTPAVGTRSFPLRSHAATSPVVSRATSTPPDMWPKSSGQHGCHVPACKIRRDPHARAAEPAILAVNGTSPYRHVESSYSEDVETIREREYPQMSNGVYLDHSGTTIYARSLITAFADKMMSNLYGNPHSANEPARLSGEMVDEVRERTLRFLGADPKHFDLVFVANATAGIKLVGDAFRDLGEKTWSGTFWYGYHKDAHTSLVGVRELAGAEARCFMSDAEVERWLGGSVPSDDGFTNWHHHRPYQGSGRRRTAGGGLGLFAYPGQSNMTGRRLPLAWPGMLRRSRPHANTYSLLDAAALAMTSSMAAVFDDPDAAPDFTVLSLYKIFGFPDLGALVVRRDSGHILTLRKYFGGGTVTMVSAVGDAWHRSKGREAVVDSGANGQHQHQPQHGRYQIHDGLEDGTLPFHSILALGEAIDVHARLFGSMENISRHTSRLVASLYGGLAGLRHANGGPVVQVYVEGTDGARAFGDSARQGATVAFNVLEADGSIVPYSQVEELANRKGIYIRSGGICCPGGMFTALEYEPWELERALSAGHHCGSGSHDLINQLPTGVVRASLGPMSTVRDVDMFIEFMRDTFATPRWQQSPELEDMLFQR
ncbi:hypothetical protein MCOR27_008435 [Pyricularia oryzae]|nr:hypothetical protein MCOR02_010469 [Pyricularia oryzae]KAI6272254.1 hypothetical protein MCOR27_008435 [Pyricularia oryzae]KAI6393156.1 hypothetical protein MCOR23_008106 [Pyricularia oryzae]KAI6407206.1 hypothetical protein MCOR20_005895 [Pyricularia oryzae]KAI6470986.1 hypothetical protein MCOR17_003357 [Pyricularia oryzae]